MSDAVRPLTRKHIPNESTILSSEHTARVLQAQDKHFNQSNNLEYNATSSVK